MQAKISKEKQLIQSMTNQISELQLKVTELDKRIALMTQKRSNYIFSPEKEKKLKPKKLPKYDKKPKKTKSKKNTEKAEKENQEEPKTQDNKDNVNHEE